jgi:hypothetical protein
MSNDYYLPGEAEDSSGLPNLSRNRSAPQPSLCHPERGKGSVFQAFADKQIPRCARDDREKLILR